MLNRVEAIAFLQDMRAAWIAAGRPPIRVTSWFRDEATNRRVGGARDSQHRIGTALDTTGPDERLAREARKRGIIVIDEGDHRHFQRFRAGVARNLGFFADV